MTAQEAFAIAFDEAVVMDAAAGDGAAGGAANPQGGMKNAAAAPEAKGSSGSSGGGGGGEMSMADHMQRYHPNGFDPHKNKCKLFDKMVSGLEKQGMSKEDAFNKAAAIHSGAETDTSMQGQEGVQEEKPNPELLNQEVQKMAENPQTIATAQSQELDKPETIETSSGKVTVESTVQKAIVENLEGAAAEGIPEAREALETLSEVTESEETGEETPTEEKPKFGWEKSELSRKQKNDLAELQKDFPDLTPEQYLDLLNRDVDNALEEDVEYLRKLHGQIERLKYAKEGSKGAGIRKTLEKRREEVKQAIGERLNPEVPTAAEEAPAEPNGEEKAQEEKTDAEPTSPSKGPEKKINEDGHSMPPSSEQTEAVPLTPEKEEIVQSIKETEEEIENARSPQDKEDKETVKEALEIMLNGEAEPKPEAEAEAQAAGAVVPAGERGLSEQSGSQDDSGYIYDDTGDASINLNADTEVARKMKEVLDQMPDRKAILKQFVSHIAEATKAKDAKSKQEHIDAAKAALNEFFKGTKYEGGDIVPRGETGIEPIGERGVVPAEKQGEAPQVKPQGALPAPEEPKSETPTPEPATAEGGEGGDGGGKEPPKPPIEEHKPEEKPAPEEPKPEEKKPEEPEPEEPAPTPTPSAPPAPSDEEFRVKGKDNKYKVNGITYTDVSGKGLLRGMLSSFFAGLRGEAIITGWDRITGNWDAVKRSAKGEAVRDGIAGALLKSTIDSFATRDLSDNARMELSAVQDMLDEAKTAKQRMSAVKEFQKWKDKYAEELGSMESAGPSETFGPLPNDYKGTKPPVSILSKGGEYEADKEYGDMVASQIQDRMKFLSLDIGEMSSVKVGPSSTTIKFKVPPSFDMARAQSKKTRDALQMATGTQISEIVPAKGETDMISITVTNPKMRPVGFSSIARSKEWADFSEKASLPIIVGKDSAGHDVMKDLAKMPHMIVTGATGSGKSVFVKSLLASLQMAKTPDQARIVMIDPKDEFRSMQGSPHLFYPRVGKEVDDDVTAKNALSVVASLQKEMNERIKKIGGTISGFDPKTNKYEGDSDVNIIEYNKAHPDEKMPHITMVFDEFANISKNPKYGAQVAAAIDQLTAVGRSVGINCVLITQRDDRESIPHKIQSNAPGRLRFAAAPGDTKASKEVQSLQGYGDYIMEDGKEKTRGRGALISKEDFSAVPAYYRDHMEGSPESETPPPEDTPPEGEPPKPPEGESPTPPKEELPPAEEPPKEEKPESTSSNDWTEASSRKDAVDTLEKIRAEAKSKAFEEYKKTKRTAADKAKYKKAIQKADDDYHSELEIVDSQFPDIGEGDDLEDAGNEAPAEENKAPEPEEDEDEDTPQKLIDRARNRMKTEREKINKQRDAGKITEREAMKRKQELTNRFKAAEAKFNNGGTAEDILNELEPEEKPPEEPKKEESNESPAPAAKSSQLPAPEEETNPEAEAAKQQEEKDKALSATVRPPKFYSGKSAVGSDKAVEMLTPKEQKKLKETLVPPGWDFVTDNGFNAPARTANGKIFVKHPTNGSYGWIYKDKKGNMRFWKEVDTTHPNYKGFVQNEKGEWELTPEGKKAEAEAKRIRKYSDNEAEREEAQRKLNNIRFGRDEAPDNRTLVADAIARVLSRQRNG